VFFYVVHDTDHITQVYRNTNVKVYSIESMYTWLVVEVKENGQYSNIEQYKRGYDMDKRNIMPQNNHI
jgi:hypothetical protein